MDNKIVETAEKLFLKYGIRSISMDDISKEIGISKKTLYQSIDTKETLIYRVVKNHMKREKHAIKAILNQTTNAVEEMILISRCLLTFLKGMKPTLTYDLKKYYPNAWNLIDEEHMTFISKVMKQNIHKGIQQDVYRSTINEDVICDIYVQSILNISQKIYSNPIEIYKEHIIYHLHGIMNEKGIKYYENYQNVS